LSSGPHYNPFNKAHGDISAKVRHVGDYGNIVADASGNIKATFQDTVSKLSGRYSIIGRTLVLHAGEDDLGLVDNNGSRTTGNSGGRITCAVIGIWDH
jgi:Cu-Zn family superoxide dismutase